MDFRITMRELDEVIVKTQITINRELAELDAMPPPNRQRGRRRRLVSLQAHLSRLRQFRTALKQRRPAGSWLH
jgi:hypothetical protein